MSIIARTKSSIKYRSDRLLKEVMYNYPVDLVKGEKDIIYLASFARSGSTFLSQLILSGGHIRYYFEPFHKDVPEATVFKQELFLGRYQKSESHQKTMAALFNGEIYNEWIRRGTTSFLFRKRLVKSVRSHCFVAWLKQTFPDIRLIVLMRHPFAVVESMATVYHWDEYTEGFQKMFFEQKEVSDLFPQEIKKHYKRSKTDKEKWLFQWCIEHTVLFSTLQSEDFELVVYENLLTHPEEEIKRIFKFAGISYHTQWKYKMNKPSSSVTKKSWTYKNPGKINMRWKENWTTAETNRAREIMQLFDFGNLYKNSYPDKKTVAKYSFCLNYSLHNFI